MWTIVYAWWTQLALRIQSLRTSCIQISTASLFFLETEPDQEFLGFLLEFEPFALRYSPPLDFNQVMAPCWASPISVHWSGFVSRLFLVAKCAFPTSEQFRGFAALHNLCSNTGFQGEDLVAASKPVRRYLQVRSLLW